MNNDMINNIFIWGLIVAFWIMFLGIWDVLKKFNQIAQRLEQDVLKLVAIGEFDKIVSEFLKKSMAEKPTEKAKRGRPAKKLEKPEETLSGIQS